MKTKELRIRAKGLEVDILYDGWHLIEDELNGHPVARIRSDGGNYD